MEDEERSFKDHIENIYFDLPTSDKEPVAEKEKEIIISPVCHLPAFAVRPFLSPAVPPSSRLCLSLLHLHREELGLQTTASLCCTSSPPLSWWAEKPYVLFLSIQFSQGQSQKWSLYSDFSVFASNIFPMSSFQQNGRGAQDLWRAHSPFLEPRARLVFLTWLAHICLWQRLPGSLAWHCFGFSVV